MHILQNLPPHNMVRLKLPSSSVRSFHLLPGSITLFLPLHGLEIFIIQLSNIDCSSVALCALHSIHRSSLHTWHLSAPTLTLMLTLSSTSLLCLSLCCSDLFACCERCLELSALAVIDGIDEAYAGPVIIERE